MATQATDDSILWAKYLDWCSARIADRFLELTPDEIYQLAHEVSADPVEIPDRGALGVLSMMLGRSRNGDEEMGPLPERSVAAPLSVEGADPAGGPTPGEVAAAMVGVAGDAYRALVERVTEALATRLELPSFEEWVAAYRADPRRYEAELLGFWRDAV